MGEKFPVEFGEYELLRKIAQGGMAEIFLAKDVRGRVCAVKRILPHLAHQEGFIRMFIDEARIVSNLNHPNIAGVYDQGKHEGFYYIAMEYVEGHSILALMDQAKSQKMALPRGLLAFIVAELLAGLGSAHSARDAKGRHLGIVHRDVTPQNVMITYEGHVKLIDFGVAKARARLTQTEAGFTKGKLSYMSPEQARGEELDGRSDLFAVGIILYEITTGRRLYNKEGPGGILSAIVNDAVDPPSLKDRKYPRDLEAIVMRALEKDAERRWQSAEDMQDALDRFARRERPRPGANRLRDLVHDLFGDPKHRSLIEPPPKPKARPETPPEPRPESAIPAKPTRPSRPRSDKPAETNAMLEAEPSLEKQSVARAPIKREVTNEGTPIVDLQLEHDVIVPKVKEPARVRFARWLANLGAELRESWALHRRRWILSILGLGTVLGLALFFATGLAGRMAAAMGEGVDAMREAKQRAGLGNTSVDAGIRPTVLVVASEPPGASITVDGVGAGCVTPCELEDLELGRPLSVELYLGGFRRASFKTTLQPNQGRVEEILSLERELGALNVETEPEGATVLVDGKPVQGTTPLTVEGVRTEQPLRVEVRLENHRTQRRVVVVRDGERRSESFTLTIDPSSIKPGRIDITSNPSDCAASVDGAEIGRTPASHEAKEGTYAVSVSCENYAPAYRTVSVSAGATVTVDLVPEPNVFGYLSVSVSPAQGSLVSINGRDVAQPIRFLKVIPGRHEIFVKNDGLRRERRMSVSVGPNQKISREVDLYR